MRAIKKLQAVFVAFLVVLLPVSTSVQVAQAAESSYAPLDDASYESKEDFQPQAVCTWPSIECNDKCWTQCSSDREFYCGDDSYSAAVDVNRDGAVDIKDLTAVGRMFWDEGWCEGMVRSNVSACS